MSSIINLSEIYKNKLYFATCTGHKLPYSVNKNNIYVSIDDLIEFPTILSYFGPPSLGNLYHYSYLINNIIKDNNNQFKKIIHCTSILDDKKRTNAAFLIGAFSILYLEKTPKEASKLIKSNLQFNYLPFCDTTYQKTSPNINMKTYFNAIYKAAALYKFFSFNDFNINEYDYLSSPNGGDMNWVVPGKFLAFMGPIEQPDGTGCEIYVNYFYKNNINTVIRLNNPMYNANNFKMRGIRHYDLFFPDCTSPDLETLRTFLNIAENTPSAIAIHCKAGMGRTGTLIAAYLIKHYNFNALEAVSWLRICRPGSVIGIQQNFLVSYQDWLKAEGKLFRTFHNENSRTRVCQYGLYSIKEKLNS